MSPAGRPAIPAVLKRQVLVEAGHRCAIPQCRQVPPELAHITPWSEVAEHAFDNLIALCPTCHARFDHGDIDRTSMRQYKANLGVLRSRYSDLELRMLKLFANDQVAVSLPAPSYVLVMHLLDDGLVLEQPRWPPSLLKTFEDYVLTDAGGEAVRRLRAGQPLDG